MIPIIKKYMNYIGIMTYLIVFLTGGLVGGLASLIDETNQADDADTLLHVAVGALSGIYCLAFL